MKGDARMALLNGKYVFVESENINYKVESTSHPTESGIDLTDHVRRAPIELSLSGKIVDNGNNSAKDILDALRGYQNQGTLIRYVGKNSLSNLQIQDISITSDNTTASGYGVEITLKEVRIAKPAFDAAKSALLDLMAALQKKRQTSTQQVKQGDSSKVYHTVVKGDCVWNLVTGPYKDLKPHCSSIQEKCDWVMSQNQGAFSRPGDFRTLQIGQKLYIGDK